MAHSKFVSLLTLTVITGLLALLPEFIPEDWKLGLVKTLGSNYSTIWTLLFVGLTMLLMYFTWNESSGSNTINIKGSRNRSEQTGNGKANKANIDGDDNENKQL